MRPTFDQTVSVLVKAYLNDTLEHRNYCACAVGNIIAESIGAKIIPKVNSKAISKFKWLHDTYDGHEWFISNTKPVGRELIETTGYTVEEILRIEKSFERAHDPYKSYTDDATMFNVGLAYASS